MNIISSITKDHTILESLNISNIVYLYLLSNAVAYEDEIICDLTVTELHDKFKNFSENDIETAFEELESKKYIVIQKSTIIIGSILNGKKKLFTGDIDNCYAERDKILEYANEFIKALRGSTNAKAAKTVYDNVVSLFSIPFTKWTYRESLMLFKYAGDSYFQMFSNEPQVKEHGQMKMLYKLYDIKTLVKLICHYIINNEQYGKGVPTIGGLLFKKDDVYHDVKGLNRKSKAVSVKSNNEEFL